MSIAIMSQVWKLQGLSSTQKLVLLSLADNANDGGECYPSIAQIEARTCLSERAIRGAIRSLEAAGLVRTVARAGTSAVYFLTVSDASTPAADAAPAPRAAPAADAAQGGTTCRGEGHDVPGRGARAAPKPSLNRQRTVSEPSKRERAAPVALPEWLPADAWAMWDRYKAGKGWTADAKALSIRSLERLKAEGHEPATVIELAILSGWRGLYAPKASSHPARAGPASRSERNAKAMQEFLDDSSPNPFAGQQPDRLTIDG